jgi:hypothetical protein
MKSNNRMLAVAVLFLVLALAFGVVIWNDTSLSAMLAFFATGFGSGAAFGAWVARRQA